MSTPPALPNPSTVTYKVHVEEFLDDLEVLQTDYKLQLAKSVANSSDKKPEFNVVFQSKTLAPNMEISWNEVYGLNWTQSVDAPGVKVQFGGQWAKAGFGEVFNLDKYGIWVKDNTNNIGKPDAFVVGRNSYSMAVHVIVGMQDPSKVDASNPEGWVPIYVSPTPLVVHGNGTYTPKQKVQIWFEANDNSGKMISTQRSITKEYDMTGKTEHYFRLNSANGEWEDQNTAFSPPAGPNVNGRNGDVNLIAMVQPTHERNGDDLIRNPNVIKKLIIFVPPIISATRAIIEHKIKPALENISRAHVDISTKDGKTFTVTYEDKGPVVEADADSAAMSGDDQVINTVLETLKKYGVLPPDETWQIKDE